MELYVYSSEMELQGIVEKIASLIWTRRYWSCGEFKLLVPFTEEHSRMLVKNNIIMKRGDDEAAQIRYVHITKNSQGLEEIEVQGKFLIAWIGKRIIKKQIITNDTTQNILYRIVRENVTNPADTARKIPDVSIATDDEDTESGVIDYTSEQYTNAQLAAAGITDLASIYKNEMVILVNTAANESAGKVENTVNSSVAQLAAGAAQVNAGLQSAVAKKDTLETALGQLVAGSSSVSSGSAQLNSGLSQLKSNNDTLNGGIANAVSGAKQLDAGAAQLTAASGVPALVSGTSDLKKGIGQLSESSPALVTGINALDDGAKQLKIGTAQLLQGAGALASGVTQLNDGAHELSDGAEQLNDGVVELNNGMIQFNEEGISQITSLVGSDADDAIDTIKKVINLGKDYQSFAGKADDMDGSVTFIYKTEGVTK